MKTLVTLLSLIPVFGVAFAQKVYITKHESQAQVKVYKVSHESQADLKVYEAKYNFLSDKNSGIWTFESYESGADKKIFFVAHESQADLKIYYVQHESQAGWINEAKKSLME